MNDATRRRMATIRQVLGVLHEPGSVIEIRALGVPGKGKPHTVAGYFDDFDAAAEAVARLDDRKPAGIYLTLNAIAPALLARSPNKLVDYLEPLTSDSDTDVVRRRWLLLDFDPRRPTGVPSTDAEHQGAREAATWSRQWLESLGWPAPIFA